VKKLSFIIVKEIGGFHIRDILLITNYIKRI